MKTWAALAFAAGLYGLGGPVQAAVVLDFNEFASDGPDVRYFEGASFEYKGFRFVSTYGGLPAFGSFARSDPRNADPGGAAVYQRWSDFPLVVSRVDGGAFDLISLDIADLLNTGAAATNSIQFIYADGRPSDGEAFSTDATAGLQTIAFNRSGLTSFRISSPVSQWIQFDNLTIADPVSAVPEPGVWAMLIVGFGLVGSVLRGRRRNALTA
jgi:hypothetical protein